MANALIIPFVLFLASTHAFANTQYNPDNRTEYIEITPTNSFLRSAITSFDVKYSFRFGLESSRSYYIEGPSVCFDTNPTSDGTPPLGLAFTAQLRKMNWFAGGTYLEKKTLYANSGWQTIKWSNVGPGNYRINLGKKDDTFYFDDLNARIYNCD